MKKFIGVFLERHGGHTQKLPCPPKWPPSWSQLFKPKSSSNIQFWSTIAFCSIASNDTEIHVMVPWIRHCQGRDIGSTPTNYLKKFSIFCNCLFHKNNRGKWIVLCTKTNLRPWFLHFVFVLLSTQLKLLTKFFSIFCDCLFHCITYTTVHRQLYYK